MRVVITSATSIEWMRIDKQVNPLYAGESTRLQVSFHTSGVGILNSTFSLSTLIVETQPDLIIQVGMAGCFDKKWVGKVVVVKDEFLGDLGVEEKGVFKDVFDMKLAKPGEFPFSKKALQNPWLENFNLLQLPTVTAVTVNEVTTRSERINQLKNKYGADVETMEGAALHYIGLQTQTPVLQLRAISNVIGERDKSKWLIDDSLNALAQTTLKYLDRLYKLK